MANTFDDGYRAGYQAGYSYCEKNSLREVLDRKPWMHNVVSQGVDWEAGWDKGLTAGCNDLSKKRDGFDVLVDVSPAWSSPKLSIAPSPSRILPTLPVSPPPPAESNTAWWVAAAAALGLGTWFLTSKGGK